MKKYFYIFSICLFFVECTNAQDFHDIEYKYNEPVVSQLQKAGDNLSKPRIVQHWAYFPTENDRNEFIKSVTGNGYKIDNTNFVEKYKHPFSVTFSKINSVTIQAMIPVTKKLKELSKKYNGDYDGWETSVEK